MHTITYTQKDKKELSLNTKWLILINHGEIYMFGKALRSLSISFELFHDTDIFIAKR